MYMLVRFFFNCVHYLPELILYTGSVEYKLASWYVCFCLFGLIMSQSTSFRSCQDRSSWVELVLSIAAVKVLCSRTQHSDSSSCEPPTSNPSIPSLYLYQPSHCASHLIWLWFLLHSYMVNFCILSFVLIFFCKSVPAYIWNTKKNTREIWFVSRSCHSVMDEPLA